MTQLQADALSRRIDAQHDELIKKIDELDRLVTKALEEWTSVVAKDDSIVARKG